MPDENERLLETIRDLQAELFRSQQNVDEWHMRLSKSDEDNGKLWVLALHMYNEFKRIGAYHIPNTSHEELMKALEFVSEVAKGAIASFTTVRADHKLTPKEGTLLEAIEQIEEWCYACGGEHSSPEKDILKICRGAKAKVQRI